MTTSFAELRQDLSTRIAALGGDWNASPVPYALHGPDDVPDAIPRSRAHLSFAVGLQSDAGEDRQRVTRGARTVSAVAVRFFARYTPGDGIASEDAALEHERDMIARIVATATDFQIVWTGSARSMVITGEWFVHEVNFTAYHRLALTA